MTTPLLKMLLLCAAAAPLCCSLAAEESGSTGTAAAGMPDPPNTVAGMIENARDEDYALLRGKFSRKPGSSKYTFSDSTGEITAVLSSPSGSAGRQDRAKAEPPALNREYMVWTQVSCKDSFFSKCNPSLKVLTYYAEKPARAVSRASDTRPANHNPAGTAPRRGEAAPGSHAAPPGPAGTAPRRSEAAPDSHAGSRRPSGTAPRSSEAAPGSHAGSRRPSGTAPRSSEAAPGSHAAPRRPAGTALRSSEAAPDSPAGSRRPAAAAPGRREAHRPAGVQQGTAVPRSTEPVPAGTAAGGTSAASPDSRSAAAPAAGTAPAPHAAP